MPSRCCVPFCKGNYPNGPKVSVYSFPKNEDYKNKWLSLIQRKDFCPNKNSRVCELHFKKSDFETEAHAYDEKSGKLISAPLKIKRLTSTAVPSVFPEYPSSHKTEAHHRRKCPESKRIEKEMEELENAVSASINSFEEYNKSRQVNCLTDIKKCIDNIGVSKFWTFHQTDNAIFFFHIELDPQPYIKYCVKINDNLELTVSFEKNPLTKLMDYSFPLNIMHFNNIISILDFIEESFNFNAIENEDGQIKSVIDLVGNLLTSIINDENENVLKFILQQLNLLITASNHFRYSTDVMVFSCILKTISTHAYNFIRQSGFIILPHANTLRRLCNNVQVSPQLEMHDENFLMYISSRFNFVNECDKKIVLLIDEIHIKPYFDYKGGTIIGAAFDSTKAATSAYVYMVSSVLSSFKEVVHILPVNSINFQILHSITKKVVEGLENIGFKVICIVTDNNSINSRAMSLLTQPPQKSFVYPHPINQIRPLFFLIDSVHIFKNIRNNWLNQKNEGKCFYYPDFDDPKNSNFKVASFSALKKLYEIESNEIITYARGLTLKSLIPTSLERQNVKLVLKIFNKFVSQALLIVGRKHNVLNYEGTAKFIEIICNWWDIFNVKTINKGIHQRNIFMEPLNGDELDEKSIFLNKFLVWLDAWEDMKCDTGSLSKETHKALIQTTHGMMEFTKYCIEECSMKYLLTGKIQTDCLEARFGKYRQMAGSQYHISFRQLLECEKKLRLQSCVKLELNLNSNTVPLIHFDCVDSEITVDNPLLDNAISENFSSINIDDSEIEKVRSYLPVITYLGGYCSHTAIKKLKCDYCKECLILDSDVNLDENYNLIKNLDRGGLKCPTQYVVTVVMYNYIVVNNLYTNFKSFSKVSNQKLAAINMTFNILQNKEMILNPDCLNGHSDDYLCKLLLSASTNIMLKNLCGKENETLNKLKEEKKNNKRRKLETLKK